jgi:hypothetical protein
MSMTDDVRAEYMGSGDPALKAYYPAWLKNIADDATCRGFDAGRCCRRRGQRSVSRAHHQVAL